jgi:hypothetical protein
VYKYQKDLKAQSIYHFFTALSEGLRFGDWVPVGTRLSAPVQTSPEAHPASCTMRTESFPGVRCDRGVTLTPHPLLVPRSKIELSYTSTLPKGLCSLWKSETHLSEGLIRRVFDACVQEEWLRLYIEYFLHLCSSTNITRLVKLRRRR